MRRGVKRLLRKLPPEIRNNLIQEMRFQKLLTKSIYKPTLRGLINCFTWNISLRGSDYWCGIYNSCYRFKQKFRYENIRKTNGR